MEKRKIFTIILSLGIAVGLTACGNSKNNSTNSTQSTASTTSNNSLEKLRKNYAKIQVGELSQFGNGGTSLQKTKQLLGTPSSQNDTQIHNIDVTSYIWKQGKTTITIQFLNNHAVTKNITGFKWNRSTTNFTLKDYKALKNGDTYASIVQKYGEPDLVNENRIVNTITYTAMWLTGVKGQNASVTLIFHDNKLTSKTEINLE
ncbi:DUF3862 domain-containing protein [Lactobacillus sp. PV012]|uniref:DUF3862 domain-containing protein n=1 Tax=Lactobacillus sp. PV012 TaxID=2594494 RepID=UPI00223F03D1|nr:DUF3862 domain-containing protein [Lactobacillus sp. PV012]